MKTKLLFLSVILFAFQMNAQTLNPTASITAAGTANTFKGGYTFAYATSGTPWTGPLISFGGFSNTYDCQLNSSYSGSAISYRTRNGDNGTWNAWNELATRGINTFTGNQTINGTVSATSFSGSGASLTGVNAVSSTFLSHADGPRNLSDRRPNSFSRSVRYDFVTAATTNSSGNYAGVMTYNTYDGTTISTGDSSYQLAYVNESGINGAGIPGLKLRKGIDTTWGNWYSIITNNATTTTANYVPIFSGTNGIKNSSIYDNGNVGIGTTTTGEKLTVAGNIYAQLSLNFQDNTKFTVTNANVPSLTLTPFSMPRYGIAAPNAGMSADLWISGNNAIRMFTGGNPNPTVNILYNYVGIGTLNPDQKLTVKGKIHSEEVIVDLAVPADYVFQKYYTGKSELKADYVMPTLAEIESFTKKNHHLPNVPSAKEIQRNGLLLGEMSNVLLQKIEELTLYAIDQQKELDRLKTENEKYKSLAERLAAIEKELKK